jgi:4-hydroxybenzoyl-CoA reductase subunit beta
VLIPLKKTKGAYEKLRVRESMDYPLAGVAVSVIDGKARICVGGVGAAPRLYVLGDAKDAAAIRDAADKASADAKPVANATLSPAYRKKMVGTLVRRAVKRVLAEGKRGRQ